MRWIDRRLLVVEGKGGVGRTTVTAALGIAAARLGRRVCVMELSGEASLSSRLGMGAPQYEPREVLPGLDLMSLTPGACLADFGERKLRLGPLAGWLLDSRLMTSFVEAVPGLQDVVQLGKVENRLNEPADGEPRYDLIVIDGPATGHGLTLLSSARSMRQMTRVGPFHDLAGTIERTLDDRAMTATFVVTLPELLPVQETLELLHALEADRSVPDGVIVNQVLPAWPRDADALQATLDALPDGPPAAVLRDLAAQATAAASRQREALQALDRGLADALPVVSLPRLEAGGAGPARLEPLVQALCALAEAR
jgi:anion-transporting  ArsA/GET3 family ATPase